MSFVISIHARLRPWDFSWWKSFGGFIARFHVLTCIGRCVCPEHVIRMLCNSRTVCTFPIMSVTILSERTIKCFPTTLKLPLALSLKYDFCWNVLSSFFGNVQSTWFIVRGFTPQKYLFNREWKLFCLCTRSNRKTWYLFHCSASSNSIAISCLLLE